MLFVCFIFNVFYLHARLLERTCCLNLFRVFGSIACLPVIETLSNDLSAYIATNVISITDGQLYFDSILFVMLFILLYLLRSLYLELELSH